MIVCVLYGNLIVLFFDEVSFVFDEVIECDIMVYVWLLVCDVMVIVIMYWCLVIGLIDKVVWFGVVCVLV